MKKFCPWPKTDELMIKYHNEEWGVPLHDDHKLFEFIVLDSFQAGLSWQIILKKREGFRKAFAGFDPKKIAKFTQKEIDTLLENADIVRNKGKINATITNARIFLDIQKEFGSFDKYIWQFTAYKTIQNNWKELSELPAFSKESDAMSKDMKKRGFKFVGTSICYAFMQGAGIINDHLVDCYRHKEVQKM
jgi:DNA-3-methyladenine glycosylase I